MNIVVIARPQYEKLGILQVFIRHLRVYFFQMREHLGQLYLVSVIFQSRELTLKLVILNLRLEHLPELLHHHLHLHRVKLRLLKALRGKRLLVH